MPIIPANVQHEPAIRRLLERGRRVYQNFGREDLAALLVKDLAFLAEDQGRAWGVVLVQLEERPITLPLGAPDRASLRALALHYGHPPAQAIPDLLHPVLHALHQRAHPTLLIVYGGEPWLTDLLLTLGFLLTETVQFFRLPHLQRQSSPLEDHSAFRIPHSPLLLRPLHPTDLDAVAQLDAQTFDPLWHYGAKELWDLLFTCRVQLAFDHDQLAGYSAVSIVAKEAHLVRIAVHPFWQGRGIGRHLLADVIDYARASGASELTLNTQISNEHAQRLYRRFGFQMTRQRVPLFTRLVQPQSLQKADPSP